MSRRPIPPWLFRSIGVAALLVALGLPIHWAANGTGAYRWLLRLLPFDGADAVVLAFVLSLLGCLLLCLAVILVIRQFTPDMPTFADEAATLDRMAEGDFSDADALLRSKSTVRIIGAVSTICGCSLAAASLLAMPDGATGRLSLLVLGIAFAVVGAIALVTGRLPRSRS